MTFFFPNFTMNVRALLLFYIFSEAFCYTITSLASSLHKSVSLSAVSYRKDYCLDGPFWTCLRHQLKSFGEQPLGESASLRVAVGQYEEKRIVGITSSFPTDVSLDDCLYLFPDSVASVPQGISDETAVDTVYHALVLQSVLPISKNVGGSDDSPVTGHVVLIGARAMPYAQALAALDAQVTLVSTQNVPAAKGVNVLKAEEGFSRTIGKFDALLDTLGNEFDDDIENGVMVRLRQNHECRQYMTTLSRSQSLVAKEGLLWGPKSADDYVSRARQEIREGIVPPPEIGGLVERLLTAKCSLPKVKDIPSWSLKDTWEASIWPMDSDGNVRYGLPVAEGNGLDDEEEEETNESRIESASMQEAARRIRDAQDDMPGVIQVRGVKGLEDEIVQRKLNCLLFLTAPYCQTCRRLKPRYRKMAQDLTRDNFAFCHADATGLAGKELGRTLGVEAVPAFLLFRQGEIYGEPFGLTKLPHPRLKAAMDMLRQGKEWNNNLLD